MFTNKTKFSLILIDFWAPCLVIFKSNSGVPVLIKLLWNMFLIKSRFEINIYLKGESTFNPIEKSNI